MTTAWASTGDGTGVAHYVADEGSTLASVPSVLWVYVERIYVLRVACCVVAALGVTSVAGAQVTDSFHDLQTSLHGGERLTITDQAGVMTSGRLIALSSPPHAHIHVDSVERVTHFSG